MNIQQQADKASNAIQALLKPNFSLKSILNVLEILRDEIDIQIESIECDIEKEQINQE